MRLNRFKYGIAACAVALHMLTMADVDQRAALKAQAEREPKNMNAHFQYAHECFKAGDYDNALDWYDKTLSIDETCPQAHFNKGFILSLQNRRERAIACFERAIKLKPDYVKAYVQYGNVLFEQKEYKAAIEQFKKAVSYDANNAEALYNIGRAFHELEQIGASIEWFERAAAINTQDAQLLLCLANAHNATNNTERALSIYHQIDKLIPNNASILYNIAYTLKKLDRIDDAMPYYERVLTLQPDHSEAHFSRGLAYLARGDFEAGWPEYEWRWKRGDHNQLRKIAKPMWDGGDLTGKTIFLLAEQGLGDTYQFIRYGQLAKQKGGRVIAAVQSPLVKILSLCPYLDKVIPLSDPTPECDVYCPMVSMPYVTKTRMESIPDQIPYLYADSALVAQWHEKLAEDKNFKIGICWQGNPNYSTTFLRAVVAAKSITPAHFAPLAECKKITIYSLQRETGLEELKKVMPEGLKIVTFDETFDSKHGRFMDTAAVMKNLDLMITVDTSIAHLAGGLGIPVWVLIPEPADWRWLLHRDDTPWYPHNMRLFRQTKTGDWHSVMRTIVDELQKVLVSGSMSGSRVQQTRSVHAEISSGELIDKITILQIKTERIKDAKKLANIRKELASLMATKEEEIGSSEKLDQLTYDLYVINNQMWDIEDAIRDKEIKGEFDEQFKELARSVYRTNDRRMAVKRAINDLLESALVEEKEYAQY